MPGADADRVRDRRFSPRALLIGLFLSALLGFLPGFSAIVLGERFDEWKGSVNAKPFSSEEWIDAARSSVLDEHWHTSRQEMVEDLLDEQLVAGLDREAVHVLLGTPSTWPIFRGASWFGREDEAWYLGAAS